MEILNETVETTMPIAYSIVLCIFVLSAFIAFIFMISNEELACAITAIIGIVCFILLFILPHSEPTGNIKYVIEVTDESYYKIIINNDYSFKKLYDNKEIYELIGPPLGGE